MEGQRHVIRDLLDGERRRLLEKLDQRIALQRKNAMTKLVEIVDRKLRENEDLTELSLATGEIFDRARQEFTSSFVAIVDSTFNIRITRSASAR